MFGSSWIKRDNIKILTLGVVGVDLTSIGKYSSIEPEIGMEIDLALNPFSARNVQTSKDVGFWILLGIRGLVGIDFIQGAKDGTGSTFYLLTATLEPKISVGMSF